MTGPKGRAQPLVRTPAQTKALLGAAAAEAAEDKLTAEQEAATQLAQIVNLHIGGYSFSQIGAAIGASESEVERMITQDTARYVRTQPALRTYVRNWISAKYLAMIEADMDIATDKTHKEKLEHQDRVGRFLKQMGDLHGAPAPTQTEVKVESAPENIDRIVQAIAASQGTGYDTSIFDTVPGEVVHAAVAESRAELQASSDAVEQDQPGDGESL